MSASLLPSSESSGALDIVFDPAPPRARRRLPAAVWLIAFALWAAGFLGAGLTIVRHRAVAPAPGSSVGSLTDLWRAGPDGWWYWLVVSTAGAVVGAAMCVLQRRR